MESAGMNSDLLRQVVCVLAVIGTIVGNALANAIPFNGQTTGEISNRFDVLFVPSGYVFGIWGLIYLSWLFFAVFQFLPSQKANPRLRRIIYPFALSCVANVGWLLMWHYEQFFLSVLVMLTLLGLLILIYSRLGVGKVQVGLGERLCVHLPFSLYLAWISVATIANITIFLSYVGWSGWGIPEPAWANIMIATAATLGIIACLQRRDFAFVVVLIWAFVGIADKQAGTLPVYVGAWTATSVLVLVVMICVGGALKNRLLPTAKP